LVSDAWREVRASDDGHLRKEWSSMCVRPIRFAAIAVGVALVLGLSAITVTADCCARYKASYDAHMSLAKQLEAEISSAMREAQALVDKAAKELGEGAIDGLNALQKMVRGNPLGALVSGFKSLDHLSESWSAYCWEAANLYSAIEVMQKELKRLESRARSYLKLYNSCLKRAKRNGGCSSTVSSKTPSSQRKGGGSNASLFSFE
jgi:prefoldin subunit 5